MGHKAGEIEKEAHSCFAQCDFQKAGKLFKDAAEAYSLQKEHNQAAICFASSAGAWALEAGERPFYHSALSYEQGACQSELAHDYEYASILLKHAAICHEKDLDFGKFSECFYRSKENFRKYLANSLFSPGRNKHIGGNSPDSSRRDFFHRLGLWLSLTVSCFAWGHGERPARALFCGLSLVILSALIYTQGFLLKDGQIFRPDFFNAFYFSMVSFTTVGYGDITPVGLTKAVVILELFCGIFIVPLFIVALSRKYLRA